MLDHTQLKQHDNAVASLDQQLHATNKQNTSTIPIDTGALLFWSVGNAQACLTKSNKYYMI